MDLKTNKAVKFRQDENTHICGCNYPATIVSLLRYYDPVNHDTSDSRGRIVNNALVLTNGSYTIDETKIKSNNDAFKIKNDQIKLKMDDNDIKMKDGDIKIKDKDDSYKDKIDTTKLKVKDDKMRLKANKQAYLIKKAPGKKEPFLFSF